jgi:hypothetical protein
MAKKNTPKPITPPPFPVIPDYGPLEGLLHTMQVNSPADAARHFDDLGLNTPEKAFAFLESVGRLPAGCALEEFRALYIQILAK